MPQLQLPCGHEYCNSCLKDLRSKGVDKSCPLCRKPLPPGPDKLFDLGSSLFIKVKRAIGRGRPGVDPKTPWPALSGEQRREVDESRAMLREAADQGHKKAQFYCGVLFHFGYGVEVDYRLALVYYEKGGQLGHAECQHNAGTCYRDGTGCEQNNRRAAHWFEKAAQQNHADATCELGNLHYNVQKYKEALKYFIKAAELGSVIATYNIADCHEHGYGIPQNYQEALRLYNLAAIQGCGDVLEAIKRCEAALRDDPTQALSKPKQKKTKPNQPCSCGSGKKYKKCCGGLR